MGLKFSEWVHNATLDVSRMSGTSQIMHGSGAGAGIGAVTGLMSDNDTMFGGAFKGALAGAGAGAASRYLTSSYAKNIETAGGHGGEFNVKNLWGGGANGFWESETQKIGAAAYHGSDPSKHGPGHIVSSAAHPNPRKPAAGVGP